MQASWKEFATLCIPEIYPAVVSDPTDEVGCVWTKGAETAGE